MKAFLRRLFGKSKPKEPSATAAPAEPKKKETKSRRRTDSSFEPLEGRIAPAVLLSPTTIQFTDVDGDLVTVTFSKGLLDKVGSALNTQLDGIFKFKDSNHHVRTAADGGSATDVNELALIDLSTLGTSSLTNPALNTNITITAKPQGAAGNDLVNIGYIKSQLSAVLGTSLGHVIVDGDLGQIDAGDPNRAVGLASLTVQSLGGVGLASQNAGGSLTSNITGAVTKVVIKGDMVDATLKVVSGIPNKSPGKIGSLTIGGSLRVSDGTLTNDIAQVVADDSIGAIKIGTTASHGIFGGAGNNTALIKATGKIGSVTISGDIRGGAGKDSGEINGAGGIGNLTLGGSLWAGTGENSGRVVTNGNIGAIKMAVLHGDAPFAGGDSGLNAATISAGGNVTSLTATGALLGGKGLGAGSVTVGGKLGSLTIGAELTGGLGKNSGRVNAGSIGSISIDRIITGGDGESSGSINSAGSITSLLVKNSQLATGALVAGKGIGSGSVTVGGNLGVTIIKGALDGQRGGTLNGQEVDTDNNPGTPPVAQLPGVNSAHIHAEGSIASITINGALIGGLSEGTAGVSAGTSVGNLTVTGSLFGGGGLNSGSILAGGKISGAIIQGSVEGGAGENSGALVSGQDVEQVGDLTKATINGAIKGGGGNGSGSVRAGGKLASFTVGLPGNAAAIVLQGAGGGGSGSVFAEGGIGLLNLQGTVIGGAGQNSGAVVSTGAAITIKISGDLTGSTGNGSGSVQVRDWDVISSIRPGSLTTLTIGGAVTGNAGIGSGQILVEGSATTLKLGALSGGTGENSGSISVGGGMAAIVNDHLTIGGAKTITINGALSAGSGTGSGTVDVASKLGSLTINGAVNQASVLVGRDLAKLKITGAASGLLVSALGNTKTTSKTDLTIGSVTITGAVSDTVIRAGYDRFGNPLNGGAQIGTVNVTGDWTASSIVAGVEDVAQDGFGDEDDVAIASSGPVSKIASIVISGNITGTAPLGDHFGFTAKMIGSIKIAGLAQALTANPDTIDLAGTPATNDITIREFA